MIISKIPQAERKEVHLKASAAEALDGRRREWGCRRRWKGDYMSLVSLFDSVSVVLILFSWSLYFLAKSLDCNHEIIFVAFILVRLNWIKVKNETISYLICVYAINFFFHLE